MKKGGKEKKRGEKTGRKETNVGGEEEERLPGKLI